MIPEGNLEHQELKKNKQNVKYLGKYNRRSSYLDFFKIDFQLQAKNITLSNGVFKVCR